MGKLLIILCDTPFQSERVEHALKIAEAALQKGHKVSFYLFMDGVYNILASQNGRTFRIKTIAEKFREIIKKEAKVAYCRFCSELRGLEKRMIIEEAVASGVAELSDEISRSDSILSFT